MPFDPEAIEAALFALIQGATTSFGFQKVSRRFELWTNAGIENQDALYLVPFGGQIDQQQVYGPSRYQMEYRVGIYSYAADDREAIPQKRLNAAWKAIDTAMRGGPPGSRQTLGGLVENAWIEGNCGMFVIGSNQQMELVIPIRAITGI